MATNTNMLTSISKYNVHLIFHYQVDPYLLLHLIVSCSLHLLGNKVQLEFIA